MFAVRRFAFACLILACAPAAHAITFKDTTVDDPIASGAQCNVKEPQSWGGYIYQFPSKWDFAFWPKTEGIGLWFCETSGFTAFIGDFDEMTDAEKTAIRAWLATNYDASAGKADTRKRLELLEGIYALRAKDAEFRNELLRVLAYWFDELGDPAAANAHRQRALKEIRAFDTASLKTQQRLAYRFVAANYEREFGNDIQADADLAELEAALKAIDKDDEAHDFAEYLRKLVPGSRTIKPGGKLAPDETPGDKEGA